MQGVGCMRAELMVKARQRAPSWFGLTDLELGEMWFQLLVASAGESLLYGGINLKVSDIFQLSTTTIP